MPVNLIEFGEAMPPVLPPVTPVIMMDFCAFAVWLIDPAKRTTGCVPLIWTAVPVVFEIVVPEPKLNDPVLVPMVTAFTPPRVLVPLNV